MKNRTKILSNRLVRGALLLLSISSLVAVVRWASLEHQDEMVHAASAAEDHSDHDHDKCEHAGESEAEHDAHVECDHSECAHAEESEAEHDAHAGHDHDEAAHAEESEAEHDAHVECGHSECSRAEESEAEHDAHAGHNHAESGPEGHVDEEGGLRLTAEQRKRFGIVVRKAGSGSLRSEVSLPGEILFNEDRVAHLVPRVPGIAVDIRATLGDRVKAGQTLAISDSAELASAKLDFVAAATEVGCCRYELPRAQAIHDNTLKMLELLRSAPSLERLRGSVAGEMGEYRSRLITAYAEYGRTRKEYEREKGLMAQEITSQGDFLAAESAFKKAEAEYWGTRDSVDFEVKQNLRETSLTLQLAGLQAKTAEQKLHILGLSEEEVGGLAKESLLPDGVTATAAIETKAAAGGHACDDPNCKGCAGHPAAGITDKAPASQLHQAGLGQYEIKAPFDGLVVQKHITLGERLGEDSDIFMIADTNTVWVNLTVYAKDLAAVHKGQEVVLEVDHSGAQARGTIAMVTPFVEESTRSATARVILDNSDGRWRPGTFVTGFISTSEEHLPVVVPRNTVQSIEGRDVVFVDHQGAFEATPVVLGRSDRTSIEVLSGLKPGTLYVADGAFQLKATAITSNLDSHAGHGH